MLTKKDILSKVELRYEDVQVDEWGGEVRISEMTAGAYDRYQRSLYKVKGAKIEQDLTDMTSSFVSACIVDEEGGLMFTLDEVKKLPAKVISRLYDVAQRVNGEGAGRDELAKNSGGGQDE
jgi:hypothetical protein